MAKFTITETCTYEIEAESMNEATAKWLNGGITGNIWELMQGSFCEVTERWIEPQEPNAGGELTDADSF